MKKRPGLAHIKTIYRTWDCYPSVTAAMFCNIGPESNPSNGCGASFHREVAHELEQQQQDDDDAADANLHRQTCFLIKLKLTFRMWSGSLD